VSFRRSDYLGDPAVPLARDAVRRFADLGVDRLVPIGLGADGDALVAQVERLAEAVA